MKFKNFNLDRWLENWLAEDIGSGDLTTDLIVPEAAVAKACIHSKDIGLLAGVDVAGRVFTLLNPDIQFTVCARDGAQLDKQTVIATVEGDARSILAGERLALNLLQHLSGIATQTAHFTALAAPYGARLVDTRKTTPGLRLLEKYAVRVGGGFNHRLGLYDAVLIKDNHIKVAGGIKAALELVKQEISHMTKIEIEVENIAGVEAALRGGADVIMLDNMDCEQMIQAVKLIDGRVPVEASGGITAKTVAAIAATGVDIISVGALTHSVRSLDISLDIDLNK
ncbi:carboxylating nicotinate-nucleotide diphosphorylase [Propionispira raffinosivorans]|uniref:carboxylating nicotinate-nucleotide diphosphorylase n=1 Tax=Propionispira raffinosivorans TaxID=86959 RepID=UPI000379D777|nr:carboxylating nicotinate-nucleotide diphosphorylase [Propionispira raffinosivorans]